MVRDMDGELKHQVSYQGNRSPFEVLTRCWYNFIKNEWIMQRLGLDGLDGEFMCCKGYGSGKCLDGMRESECDGLMWDEWRRNGGSMWI